MPNAGPSASSGPPGGWKGPAIGCGALLAGLAGLAIWQYNKSSSEYDAERARQQEERDAANPHAARQRRLDTEALMANLALYTDISGLKDEAGSGYIRGKIVIVDLDKKSLGQMISLPDELMAEKPAEVGTVVWIKRMNRRVGKEYSLHGIGAASIQAIQIDHEVTVIDFARAEIVARDVLPAPEPPAQAEKDMRLTSSRTAFELEPTGLALMKYLQGLERK